MKGMTPWLEKRIFVTSTQIQYKFARGVPVHAGQTEGKMNVLAGTRSHCIYSPRASHMACEQGFWKDESQ